MTLTELAPEYRRSAAALRVRIAALTLLLEQTDNDWERALLTDRIRMLTAMWRDTRDVAVCLEHYYDRGYCRNVRYKL